LMAEKITTIIKTAKWGMSQQQQNIFNISRFNFDKNFKLK